MVSLSQLLRDSVAPKGVVALVAIVALALVAVVVGKEWYCHGGRKSPQSVVGVGTGSNISSEALF